MYGYKTYKYWLTTLDQMFLGYFTYYRDIALSVNIVEQLTESLLLYVIWVPDKVKYLVFHLFKNFQRPFFSFNWPCNKYIQRGCQRTTKQILGAHLFLSKKGSFIWSVLIDILKLFLYLFGKLKTIYLKPWD